VELVAEGVLDAIGGGLKTFFGQLSELLLFAFIVVSRADSVFAARAVLVDVVHGAGLLLCVGAEVVFVDSGAKGRGARVESGKGDGAAVRAKEVEKGVGLLLFDCELAKDVILMGAKLSYDVSTFQLFEDV
jgi:hypothetical protein